MVIVRLKGGIGNQLFQFAFGRAIAQYRQDELYFDLTYLTRNPLNFVPRDFKLERIKNVKLADHTILEDFGVLYESGHAAFIKDNTSKRTIRPLLNNIKIKAVMLDGYYQNEFYQLEYGELIKDELREFLNYYFNADVAKSLIYKNQETVSVHLRRGDYLSPDTLQWFGICEAKYYKKAIEMMQSHLSNPYFYIFSDDAEKAEELFSGLIEDKTNVSSIISHVPSADSDLMELALMTQCKHFILANSNYSWWGSYLAESADKLVIAPKQWYHGEEFTQLSDAIGLNSWIRI